MMQNFSISPIEMVSSLWRNRDLIIASTKREVLSRYRGSILGLLWSFFNPLLMLLVYTFVFGFIFQARWNTNSSSKSEFAMLLFSGLMVFNLFSECINRAPGLIISNANYVKKVVYPLEILPAVTLLSSFFQMLISLIVWFIAHFFFFGAPHVTSLLLPMIILPFMMFIMGISWVLASLGVFLRDVAQVVGVFTSVLLFLCPIFYPASAMPEDYRFLLYFNPLTPVVEITRDVLFFGKTPGPVIFTIYWVKAITTSWIGFFWFQKTRKGFADVL